MAEGGVTLPGVGKVSKKWLIIVGGASVASIGWFVWKRKHAAAAAPAGASADDGSDIDPLTGDVAGSEQDQADLAAMQAGGDGDLGLDGLGGSGLQNFGGVLAASPPGATIPGAGGFTTNGEWAQQAEADLAAVGVDPVALSGALGHYLTGSPLSGAEQGLVDQAIAEEGYPPVAGPAGYPPAMHATATGSGSGNGTPPPGGTPPPAGTPKVEVPAVVGQRVTPAVAALQKAGFTVHTSSVRDPASEYKVNSQTPGGKSMAPKGSRVDLGIVKI